MKLKLVKMAPGIRDGIFFWEEGPEDGPKEKKVQSIALNQDIVVDDPVGHEIMSKYKGLFEVVFYGSKDPEAEVKVEKKAMSSSPRNAMVKEEKVKEEHVAQL